MHAATEKCLRVHRRPCAVLFSPQGSYNRNMKNNVRTLTAARKSRPSVAATASFVTVLSVAERGLGFLYRIALSRLLGAEGLGLYQVSLSLFAVFLTIGTGGIPLCVSRLIAKSKAENDRRGESNALSAGLLLALLLTLPVTLLLEGCAQYLPFLFSDPRCVRPFKILLVGLALSALYAVFRGYFWGNDDFVLPSFLEIAEETVMVVCGVLLLQTVRDPLDGATKAAYAVLVSYAFSFTASAVCFFFRGGRLSSPKRALPPLLRAASPITAVRVGGSLLQSAIAVLLPTTLVRVGFTQSEAIKAYGVVSGMAMPVLFIPATVISSLALVLVPRLSEDFYRGNTARLYENIRKGLRISFLVACTLTPFFAVLGDEVGLLAFASVEAGAFIRAGAPLLIPLSLTMITTSILNSMGFERQTFVFYFLSAATLLLCVLLLPRVCGVYAYLWGMGASYCLNACCNLRLLTRKCKGVFSLRRVPTTLYRALVAAVCAFGVGCALSPFFKRYCGETLAALAIGGCMAACLCALFFAFGLPPFPTRRKKRKKSGE